MGNYAAEIRVNTKIDTKQASSQLLFLENRMLKASDKADTLNKKMKELEREKAPTETYRDLQNQLETAGREMERLIGRQNDLESIGIKSGSVWNGINEEIAAAGIKTDELKEKMYQLETAGKAFTLGSNTAEYEKLAQQRKYEQNNLEALQQKHSEVMEKMDVSEKKLEQKSASTFRRIAAAAKKALGGTASLTRSVFTKTAGVIRKAGDTAKKVFRKMHGDTKKQNSLLSTLKSRFSGIALSLLVFNWVTRGFNAVVASVKDGVKNLARYSGEYNAVVSDMVSALATLKNSFVTAFAPIMTVALPYLTQLINFLTTAVNKVAQFIAALTGKSAWTKAKKQTTDYAGSLNEVSGAAKEAFRSLAAFDELNVLDRQEEAAGAGAGGTDPSDLFEEVPIDSRIKEFADKVKAVLAKLFEPLKKAWDRQGKKVMDAWKYALKEVSGLVRSVGNDFLEVWTQEATVTIFEDVLLILADIGLVIGNLARQFRKAWEENETGKKILENIRDLIGIIVKNLRNAADFTVDWSDKLDFSPLLETFGEFTKSLAGPVDFISGVLSDFYRQVLLPLSKWTIEKGLPEFLAILTDFNNKVNWEGLRQRLSEFWKHLEPFAETIGEGLLIFIRDLSNRLAGFVNSGAFEGFLTKLEEWMDNTEPEDIAKAIGQIAGVLIGLKIALAGFEAVRGIAAVFTTIKTFLSFFGAGGAGTAAAGGMGTVTAALTGLAEALGMVALVAVQLEIIDRIKDKIGGLAKEAGYNAQQVDYMTGRYEGWGGKVRALSDYLTRASNGLQGFGLNASNAMEGAEAFGHALDSVADGTIYTDAQLEKMRKNFALSDEDLESLRQAMLDANPELRNLADGFGLFGASAQTLQNVSDGMEMLRNNAFGSVSAFEQYAEKAGYTSEAIETLKGKMQDGLGQSIEDFGTDLENTGQNIEDFREDIVLVGKSMDTLKEDFSTAGTDMSSGFIEGFENGAENVNTTTDNFCRNFIGRIKELLGIHSPSTVMAEIGSFIMQGLVNGIEGMRTGLGAALDGVYNTVSGILDKIRSYVSGMVETIKSKISSLTSGVSSAWSSVTSRVSGIRGRSMPVPAAYSYGLPELATGGITTGTTIAKIGEAGREAVLPLENNTGWMDVLADKINGSGTITLTAELDGREIFRNVMERSEIYSRTTGKSAFAY